MPLSSFDKYYQNLPPFDREKDFDAFWQKAISDMKRIPVEPVMKQNPKKSTERFLVFDAAYNGFLKTHINGEILIPVSKKKPKVIIHLHEYAKLPSFPHKLADAGVAHFFITLRGHGNLPKAVGNVEPKTPGYMVENILDRETYYVKSLYLDIYRSVDMLRLVSDLDCSSIGIIGKGLGAAAAVFTAAHSPRVTALSLLTPSFCHLPMSQNISTGDTAAEINSFIEIARQKKKQIKANLTYFDAMNFSDKIKIPVLVTVGFRDTVSPPECVFALFNHLLCDKTIEIYPDEGNDAGGEKQYLKSIKWIIDRIDEPVSGAGAKN